MTKPTYDAPAGSAFTSIAIPAVCCGTLRDHIFIAPSSNRYSVRWGALGDPTDWPTPGTTDARTKQAGEQILQNKFGLVTAIAGNDFYGYIFQERAITKATYVGGDLVYTFDAFEEGRGCHKVNRIARVDDVVFFESENGYHMIQDDVITDIGLGSVDKSYTP